LHLILFKFDLYFPSFYTRSPSPVLFCSFPVCFCFFRFDFLNLKSVFSMLGPKNLRMNFGIFIRFSSFFVSIFVVLGI